jgi:hypothetical protein
MFRTLARQAINPVQYINKNVSVYISVLSPEWHAAVIAYLWTHDNHYE